MTGQKGSPRRARHARCRQLKDGRLLCPVDGRERAAASAARDDGLLLLLLLSLPLSEVLKAPPVSPARGALDALDPSCREVPRGSRGFVLDLEEDLGGLQLLVTLVHTVYMSVCVGRGAWEEDRSQEGHDWNNHWAGFLVLPQTTRHWQKRAHECTLILLDILF